MKKKINFLRTKNTQLRLSMLLLIASTTTMLTIQADAAVSNIPPVSQVIGHGIPGMYFGTLRTAYIDSDNKIDVIAAGVFADSGPLFGEGMVRIYRNISTGPGDIRFVLHKEFSSATGDIAQNAPFLGLEVGDYDNDGDIDFVANFGSDQKAVVGTNNGSGVFSLIELPFIGRQMAFGDVTGNNKLEILTTRNETPGGGPTPAYYSWNGSIPGWAPNQTGFLNDVCNGGLAVGDLDGDKKNDVLVGGNCGGYGVNPTSTNTHSQWNKNLGGGIIATTPKVYLSPIGAGQNSTSANGMDNGSYRLDDFDQDGNLDIAFAGSHEGFGGPDPTKWIQYDFFILLNKDGTGENFEVWQDANGGAGNVDIQGITSGDFNKDGFPDIFFVGHQRIGEYKFQSRLYLNDGTGKMERVHTNLPHLGRGNGAFADFDNDGNVDLIYQGAELPWHSNSGTLLNDGNTANTIKTYIYRNLNDLPPDNTPPSIPQSLQGQANGENQIDLSWAASSDPETGVLRYNVFRDGAQISSVTATSFSDTGLLESTNYSYQVRAVNGYGLASVLGASVVLKTNADLVAPSLQSISSISDTKITAQFSEKIDVSSAQNSGNYTLDGALSLLNATLDVGGRTVSLTTSAQTDGATYQLTINNIKDASVAGNIIAANSQLSFTYNSGANPGGGATQNAWGILNVGERVYTDRPNIFYVTVPAQYQQAAYWRTANDDKNSVNDNFYSFTVTEATDVYVAYDVRSTNLPSWLQSWQDSADELISDDTSLRLYKKRFAQGIVVLGGNAPGQSMYTVLVLPATDTVPVGNNPDENNGNNGSNPVVTPDQTKESATGAISIMELLIMMMMGLSIGRKKLAGFGKSACKGFAVALLLIGVTNVQAANHTLLNMPDNSWLRVDTGGAITADSGILAFSGMTYDSVNQRILLFGGGHNDYWGNEIWAFDPNTFTWTRMYEPDPKPVLTSSSPPCPTPTGLYLSKYPGAVFNPIGESISNAQPLSRHTYDSVTFIPPIAELFTLGTYTWGDNQPCNGWPWGPQDTWTYKFTSNKWTYRNLARVAQPSGEAAVAEYDPVSDLVYVVATTETWTYNYKTDAWAQLTTNGVPTDQGIETGLTYDSKRQALYYFGSEYLNKNDLYKYNIATNTWTEMPVIGGNRPTAGGGYGVVYDSVSDVIHVMASPRGEGIWTYDLATSIWTNGSNVGPMSVEGRTHGNFQFDPINNVTYLVAPNGAVETWAYRYKGGIVDDTPPSVPTNLQRNSASENQIVLSWNASSDAESGVARYNIFRAGSRVGSANGTSYTDTALAESNSYSYQVSAINGAGTESALSNALVSQTMADLTPPGLSSASAVSATQVLLVFTETVQKISAETISNYALDGAGVVLSAALAGDGFTVTLGTSALTDATTYQLTVNNIMDNAVAANVIVANSVISFTYNSGGNGGNQGGGNATTYQWDVLNVGNKVYIDRDFTYATVPNTYLQANYLQTGNDDKLATGDNFYSFPVTEPTEVYVAYDTRSAGLPSWLQGWQDTGDILVTSDTSLQLYSKVYATGDVALGGNGNDKSMYTVVIKPVSGNGPGEVPVPDGNTGGGNPGGGNGGTDPAPTEPTPTTPTTPTSEENASAGASSVMELLLLMFAGWLGRRLRVMRRK